MTAEQYPEAALESNYCRNPDASPTIWCYTNDPDVTWDYCDPIGSGTSGPVDVSCPPGWTMTDDRTACYMTTWTTGEPYCPEGWLLSDDGQSCTRDISRVVQCPPGWTLADGG